MAGLGRRTFAPGEVLTASNVMNYLMDQSVMSFAGTAARGSAIGSAVAEGMVTYLADTNSVEVYTGSAWNPISQIQSPNVIINGAFDIWQRGTSFTPAVGISTFNADRFFTYRDGSGSVVTVSQQAFTPGAAPISGSAAIEGTNFLRFAQTTAGTGGAVNGIYQNIEDVRTLAGQTVAISFWAKADTTRTITPQFIRSYGTGGSTTEAVVTGSAISVSTSWARYTSILTIPGLSGKTIGAGSYLSLVLMLPINTTQTIDIWGVQLEKGNTATDFRRNAPSIAGELAACQRYYWRNTNPGYFAQVSYWGGTQFYATVLFPVVMRATPTASSSAAGNFSVLGNGANTVTSTASFVGSSTYSCYINGVCSAGSTGDSGTLFGNTAGTFFDFSAEL